MTMKLHKIQFRIRNSNQLLLARFEFNVFYLLYANDAVFLSLSRVVVVVIIVVVLFVFSIPLALSSFAVREHGAEVGCGKWKPPTRLVW